MADPVFADTFARCWKFGQSEEPANSKRFDRLMRRSHMLSDDSESSDSIVLEATRVLEMIKKVLKDTESVPKEEPE